MTINNFFIEYDAINSRNTFTNGDTINGRIIVETSKETKVQSLTFVAKGKARVCWHEQYGQYQHRVYWADEKYYEVKHHILRETRRDGKIVHKLKAELRQSMKLTKKAKVHFVLVSKADMDIPGLMEPQKGSKDKTLLFGSGDVSMDVHTKRMGYIQGRDLKVKVEINNHSSRSVKPKFILYEKKSYFAQGNRKVCTNTILKGKTEAVAPSSRETVTKVISIPRELPPSILNCSIIKLEYRLKIQLDIKYAIDPVIKLPVVVLPETPTVTEPHLPAEYGFAACGELNQWSWRTTPQQGVAEPEDLPPPYGAYSLYPSFNSNEKK
ncbi:hypothetical protein INR49_022937 [Caranx melampygus]|nr:hypothetical protein INR49_022937 [Caranx melampygus]